MTGYAALPPIQSYEVSGKGFIVTLPDGQVWGQTEEGASKFSVDWRGPASSMRVAISPGCPSFLQPGDGGRSPASQGDARPGKKAAPVQGRPSNSVRRQLAILDGLVRLWIPHSGFVYINAETSHHDRYDNRHQGTGFFVRRVFGMMEFLQIRHCYLPDCFIASPFPEQFACRRFIKLGGTQNSL